MKTFFISAFALFLAFSCFANDTRNYSIKNIANWSKGVYWCARDLDGPAPIGNHHFLLFIGDSNMNIFSGAGSKSEEGVYFMTASAGAENTNPTDWKRLKMEINASSDIQAVLEGIDPDQYTKWYRSDYDIEAHKITELSTADFPKAKKYLENYFDNQKNQNVHGYDITDINCATWVNTFLKALGIPENKREDYGEFNGVDWGEEDEFDISYFTELKADEDNKPITNFYLSLTSGGAKVHPPKGYTKIPVDLNTGAKGDWIYLFYTRETAKGQPVTNVVIESTTSTTYSPPPGYTNVANNVGMLGDLNRRSSTNEKIYMSFKRIPGQQTIKAVSIMEGNKPTPDGGWAKLNCNLNKGTNGKELYLLVKY